MSKNIKWIHAKNINVSCKAFYYSNWEIVTNIIKSEYYYNNTSNCK